MPGCPHWCAATTADTHTKMMMLLYLVFRNKFFFCFFTAFVYFSSYIFIFTFVFYFLAHLLCESLVGPDPESPSDTTGPDSNVHFNPCSTTKSKTKQELAKEKLGFIQSPPKSVTISTKSTGLPLENSFTAEEDQKTSIECALQPACVYTIATQRVMLMSSSRDSKESLELDVLKEKSGSGGSRGGSVQPSTSPSSASSSPTQHNRSSGGRGANNCSGGHHHHCNHHHGIHHYQTSTLTNAPSSSGGISGACGSSSSNQVQPQIPVAGSHSHHTMHHHTHHHHNLPQPPLQTSVSAQNIRSLGDSGKGEAEYRGLACEACSGAPSRSQGSLDLESTSRDAGKQHRRIERMWSVDRVTGLERGERVEDTKEVRGPEIQMGGNGRAPPKWAYCYLSKEEILFTCFQTPE